MPRPAFTVVSSSVVALVAIGFASRIFRPLIPKPGGNALANESSEFLSRAATQQINWKKPIADSFAMARRRDMPILLFIGSSYNPLARGLDNGVLMSPRVQAYLARNFECIRVDILAYPEYRNAFLPISRGIVGFPTGCQLWVLDPSGKIVDLLPKGLGLWPTDENAFIDALVAARRRFESPIAEGAGTKYQEAQDRDWQALTAEFTPAAPDFEAYGAGLSNSIYPRGGFGGESPRVVTPEAWRYLLATGNLVAFKASIGPVLRSPLVDLVDGGFFHGARDSDWIETDFDKSAVTNAAMLRVMASASAMLKEPIYRYLSERTFDSLTTEFVVQNGIAASRQSDSQSNGRSDRTSFGVRKLRESLSEGDDYQWAQSYLGLRVETNPRMVPILRSTRTLSDLPRLERILATLRRATGSVPETTSAGFADVTGFCVARLIEGARTLGDAKRLDVALSLFDWVELNRNGANMLHSQESGLRTPYVGDYLAYADAALQHYLATGRQTSIQSGREVLLRALELFNSGQGAVLWMRDKPSAPLPSFLAVPEIADSSTESATAYAMRLCHDYERVFPTESVFRRFANAATGAFGAQANVLGPRGAGFFLAAQSVFDDTFFVCVGPEAQPWSDRLAELQPWRMCIAAFGEIRVDLQKMGNGVYLVRGESVQGPMSLAAAQKALSPFIGFGR
ncbi:MAG: thioredoxin domain-containing protein [Chlorobia bacterium]|nr:thioredoxin domain-containing protein [Fimbriimonadaceae bacterium]